MSAVNGVYILLGSWPPSAWFMGRWWFLERGHGALRAMRRADLVSPLAAFPIMMGSCALLMPVGGARFVRARRYSAGAALGLTLGGIPGVLCAAFIVRSLPLEWLRWLVVLVVIYAAVLMLMSARAPVGARTTTPPQPDPLQSHDA